MLIVFVDLENSGSNFTDIFPLIYKLYINEKMPVKYEPFMLES